MAEFQKFPKIKRGCDLGEMIITEKLDGTNAQFIIEDGKLAMICSRNREITPESDNFGFAAWCEEHRAELETMADGRYYGEWYGPGIQKNRHKVESKRFALFYPHCWKAEFERIRPACVGVVPLLYEGEIDPYQADRVMHNLWNERHVQGITAEGIVMYFPELGQMRKMTFSGNRHKFDINH